VSLIRVVAVLVGAALLGACGGPTAPRAAPTGVAWPKDHGFVAIGVTDGGHDKALVGGTRIVVRFHDPGEMSVDAGCNELAVHGRLDGDRIVATGFAATAKGCPPELEEQDRWIQHFFGDGPTWQLAGTELTLRTGTAELRLVDNADRPLTGTRWVVVSRTSGGTTTTVPKGVAYVIFDKNQVVGVTGCSGLAATTNVHDGQIDLEPIHRSDIPCDGPVSELDAAVMATMKGTVRYRISGVDLTLTGPGGDSLALVSQDAIDPVTPTATTPLPDGGSMGMMNGGG
jgi:heat shock protein HslJ